MRVVALLAIAIASIDGTECVHGELRRQSMAFVSSSAVDHPEGRAGLAQDGRTGVGWRHDGGGMKWAVNDVAVTKAAEPR
jgi:hypothetical protein